MRRGKRLPTPERVHLGTGANHVPRLRIDLRNQSPKQRLQTMTLPHRKRLIQAAVVGGLGILAGLFAISWWVAGALVAANPRPVGKPPEELNAQAITLRSRSGSVLAGWHTQPVHCRGVVVLLHGIRGTRLAMLERARLLHAAGFATVMVDLQAHGESSGTTITAGYLEKHDAQAAVEFARRKHPNQRIGLIGVSLGGVAAILGSPLNIDALVIESVYSDLDAAVHNRVAARLGPLASIPAELLLLQLQPRLGISRSELRPIDQVANVGCPVLIASGTEDPHTTARETQALFAAAREPKELWMVEGAAHVDLLAFTQADYEDRVLGFLKRQL